MSEFLDVAIKAAREAGTVLLDKFGKVSYQEKGPADLVTEADVMAQRRIEEILLDAFPTHYILGEESQGKTPVFGADKDAGEFPERMLPEPKCGSGAPIGEPFTWIVDPLDGTTNFVHGVPFFCSSIGLVRGNDILCGVILNPTNDELFYMEKGRGSYLNGRRLHTSSAVDPSHALTSISFATRTNFNSPDYLTFQRCVPVCQAMRRTGSTALNLAYVAAGRFDAMSCQSAHPWDVAAGIGLVLEAGGVVSNPDGSSYDLARQPLLATANVTLHHAFCDLLNR